MTVIIWGLQFYMGVGCIKRQSIQRNSKENTGQDLVVGKTDDWLTTPSQMS